MRSILTDANFVLSLFPGIGLFDMAFEQEGFCVVRGPDILWGGDIHNFHPPASKFDGIIGGPPCKGESNLAYLNGRPGVTLRHEFCRVVDESGCRWWVMEAVKAHARLPFLGQVFVCPLQNRWLGEKQSRKRYFHSNFPLKRFIETVALEHQEFKHAVLAGHGGGVGTIQRGMAKYSLGEACELQGLPADFTDHMPFTQKMKYEVIGNGVPLPMGRAIAKATASAMRRSCEHGSEPN